METYIVKVPVSGKIEVVPFDEGHPYTQVKDAVGGYIELAPIPTIPTKEPYGIDCFVDEEGLQKLLPFNERLMTFARPVYNLPLVGNAVFVAYAEGKTVGLTKADADAIAEMFA